MFERSISVAPIVFIFPIQSHYVFGVLLWEIRSNNPSRTAFSSVVFKSHLKSITTTKNIPFYAKSNDQGRIPNIKVNIWSHGFPQTHSCILSRTRDRRLRTPALGGGGSRSRKLDLHIMFVMHKSKIFISFTTLNNYECSFVYFQYNLSFGHYYDWCVSKSNIHS